MDINTAFRKLEELFTLLVLIFVVLPGCSQIEQSKKEKVKQVKKSRLRDNDLNFLDIKKLLPDRSAQKNFWVDLNGDHQEDLVSLNETYSSPSVFLRSGETLTQASSNKFFPEGLKASGLVFADVNNDKIFDVVAYTLHQRTDLYPVPIQIFFGQRLGKFISFKNLAKIKNLPSGLPTTNVLPIDIDSDGDLDLFVSNWLTISGNTKPTYSYVLINQGTEFLAAPVPLQEESTPVASYGASVCDLNFDSRPDILQGATSEDPAVALMNQTNEKKEVSFNKVSLEINKYPGNKVFVGCRGDEIEIPSMLFGTSQYVDSTIKSHSGLYKGNQLTKFDFGQLGENQQVQRILPFNFSGILRKEFVLMDSGFPATSRLRFFYQEKEFFVEKKYFHHDLINPSGVTTIDLNNDGAPELFLGQSNVRMERSASSSIMLSKKSAKGYFSVILESLTQGPMFGAKVFFYENKKLISSTFIKPPEGGLPGQSTSIIHQFVGPHQIDQVKVFWPRVRKTLDYQVSGNRVTLCQLGRVLKGFKSCLN